MQVTELARIADIIPPSAPAEATGTSIAITLMLITLLTIAGLLFYRRSLHAQFTRLRLKRRYLANREIALQLRTLIHGKHHEGFKQADGRYLQQWQAYTSRLQHACFSHTPPGDDVLDNLLTEGQYWLMQK